MSYQPKYCCQCGEKIEGIDWKFWHSHRFCELCSSEYRIYDLILPAVGFFSLLVLFLISVYFQKLEKPLIVSSNQFAGVNNSRGIPAMNNAAPANVNAAQMAAQTNVNALPVKSSTALKASDVKMKPAESSTVELSEKVYFCGAATKKGTPCSRRVRGGGRCWQHIGQAAMLAQDKLLASR